MKKINLDELEIAYGDDDPEGYRVGHCRFGPQIGATAMGATVYELHEGQSICPYHYEYGVRGVGDRAPRPADPAAPERRGRARAGRCRLLPGRAGGRAQAHEHAAETVRVMLLSDKPSLAVAVYPDSDKIGVFPPDSRDKIMVRRESAVDYFDGEL